MKKFEEKTGKSQHEKREQEKIALENNCNERKIFNREK